MDWALSSTGENGPSFPTSVDHSDLQATVPEAQDDTAQQQITQKPNRRRGRPWKCKMANVWSLVCAMELGILPESSLKDIAFVNLWDVTTKLYSAEETAELEGTEETEPKPVNNISTALWPFMPAMRNIVPLKKSVRKRGRRKRSKWTVQRHKKPRDPAVLMTVRRRIHDDIDRRSAMRKRVVAAGAVNPSSNPSLKDGPPSAALPGYNFSFKQLHTRLAGSSNVDEARDRLSTVYRSTGKNLAHGRPKRQSCNTTEALSTDHSASTRRHLPSRDTRRQKRSRVDLSGRADYYKNVARVNDDMGDIWENTTSDSSGQNEEEEEDATRQQSHFANGNVSSRGSTSSYSESGMLPLKKGHHERLLRNLPRNSAAPHAVKKRRRRRPVASSDRTHRRKSLARRSAPAPLAAELPGIARRKRCDCGNPQRRSSHVSSCKENLKNTATAILRDIRAHIDDNADTDKMEVAKDPGEEQDEGRDEGRDVSMKYEWEDDDTADRAEKSRDANSPQLSATYKTYGNTGRKSRDKKRPQKGPIDCEFVDRTETTYQSVHDSAPPIPSLKINVDEVSWGSEDSNVSLTAVSRIFEPRSSLSEGRGNEGDDALESRIMAGKVDVSDDSVNSEARQERNASMASACYVYRETVVGEAPAASSKQNAKLESRRETTKDVITYGKRNKSNGGRSSEHSSGREKNQNPAKAKNTADNNKDNESDDEKKYVLRRRSTRSSINTVKEKNNVGKLVWGNCSGWWPALIIEADQVGMASESGKMWVYWIGESQISLLNEKTQIELFSRKLEERLTQKFRKNNTRSQAIEETIKMLRQRYECTLTKPYYYWIQRNINQEELDHLYFYPYPTKIQDRLDALKEQNVKATEKYVSQQKSGSPELKKQLTEKTKDTKAVKQMEDERLPLREQIPGVIAWAKITGHNWWPAMIIDYRDCCLKEPGFGCQWIMWYGDYTVSQVHHLAFLKFHKGLEKLREYVENTKKHVYLVGVLQAAKDYCSRLGCNTDNWSLDNVFKYFSDMTNVHIPYNHLQVSESNKVYDKYSVEILKKMNEIKANPNVDSKRKTDIDESDALRRVMKDQSKLDKLCLKCLTFSQDVMEEHPFFEGSLCRECSSHFKPCMFVFGNDDKCFYCTVCAATGTVVICDREDCPRVYCTACLKYLLCPEVYDQILLEDPWECFLCRDKSKLPVEGLVRPRNNWKETFLKMFRTSSVDYVSDKIKVVNSDGKKRGIRVLSLFDGLSTGLVVLLKLGIIVDVYYASEIDQDALTISSAHFGDRVTYLGDVRDVTKEKVKEIMPIDLLIGGSPCNDLSLVNPARLGLHNPKGTGILFFEYIRILKQLKKHNKGHHLFWLYENVASMPSEFRLEMNKHLGQEPMVVDSADFSPQHRLRLYWHNLPDNPYFPQFQKQQDVQDILTPNCNRYALVKKIRTVTTRTNSLRQGKAELKPIMMKGTSDTLWITELEEIFGFPRHYTDVKNLSATSRQRLIGKSWSVQTLTAILRPLCSYFKCNEGEDSQPDSR
ncbi:PREDICTED: uncharacterized protein LOC106746476 [Dinoponera quadriceps]|uniref:DNA (cytosine-5-)-methyltransferase n=1 Tax=Dinoponera quadriceps TaxID=609295 RepID=A0A6P3XJH9_DINQU|nr:PREDICTED: uncharacterized protein LOC106746476 [Dinoponera quadriceps]